MVKSLRIVCFLARRGATRRLAGTVATLGLGLAVAGCGGGASTQTSRTVGESQPTMIAEANAICGRLNREFKAERIASAKTSEIVRLAPHRAALEAQTVRELRKLTPPTHLAHDWQQIVGYRQTLADELVLLAAAAKAKKTHAIKTLAASKERVHARLRTLAQRDGFAECAQTG